MPSSKYLNQQATPAKKRQYLSGLQPISPQQMIIEKLKLDSLVDGSLNATYKTVANFTFSDGSV